MGATDQRRRDPNRLRAAIAREVRTHGAEDSDQVAFYRAEKAERQEQRHDQLAAAVAELPATTEALAKLELTLVRKNAYHFHVVRIEQGRRTLVAQWWPSSGRTMDGQRKGQRCNTGTALVAWLRDKEARRG